MSCLNVWPAEGGSGGGGLCKAGCRGRVGAVQVAGRQGDAWRQSEVCASRGLILGEVLLLSCRV